MNRQSILFFLCALIATIQAATAYSQSASPCPTSVVSTNVPVSRSPDLVCLLPQVFGPGGLVGKGNGGPLNDTNGHEAHFQASSIRSFTPLNEEIGIELNQLPTAPPVAGYVFSHGAVESTTQSLGPILTDRADTIGRKRLFIGLSFQFFNFDKIDGYKLNSPIPAVFHHEYESCFFSAGFDKKADDDCLQTGEYRYTSDIIATSNKVNLKSYQYTGTGTYGLTDNVDLSVVVPVLYVKMGVASTAQIFNIGLDDMGNVIPPCSEEHTFAGTTDPTACLNDSFSDKGSSTGMGDVLVRLKDRVFHGEKSSLAVATEFRFPTGDANNFLGAGTWGIRPSATYSAQLGPISPHGSFSYQINGQSLLAGM